MGLLPKLRRKDGGEHMKYMARIIEDLICIALLLVLPDAVLEATGLYKRMETIRKVKDNGQTN